MRAKPLDMTATTPVSVAPACSEPMDTGPMDTDPLDTGPMDTAAVEELLTRLLSEVARWESVPPDSDFFHDLGADSLLMAHFCARVRKQPALPSLSMKDVYQHPTIRGLSVVLAESTATRPPDGGRAATPATPVTSAVAPDRPVAPPAGLGRPHPVLCGLLQLLSYLGYVLLVAVIVTRGYEWISAGSGLLDDYLRSVAFGAAVLLILCTLPIAAKWLLIGRWQPGRIRVWSFGYVRFWLVKTLVRANPLVLTVGSPLYSLYLRALGAHVGRGVTILSRSVPVCTDLLSVGDRTVVRKDALISCYRARDSVIETGPVTLGRGAVVSESTVVDIGTSMGDGAQLGHASSLHSGQAVPAGERWHGSPAQPADSDFRGVEAARCGSARRAFHGVGQVLFAAMIVAPLAAGGLDVLLSKAPQLAEVLEPGPAALTGWGFYTDLLAGTALVFFGGIPVALLLVATVSRLVGRFVMPGRVYPLYGFHHTLHRLSTVLTNRRSLMRLFGDSTAVVHYLRWIGYDLSRVEQTGSNFGTVVKHESPRMSSVGRGTMVADGLSLMNADYSSTSFRLTPTRIGARNFLGNKIAYPARGRTGDNCLLATKVMVPVDGPIRENVGLLGSPSFEIPRSVFRDSTFDDVRTGAELRHRLAAKNRHNALTMAWHLATAWFYLFLVTVLFAGATDLYAQTGLWAFALANAVLLPLTVLYYVLVERVVTVFAPLGPLFCSIYDERFWRRERYWKVPSETYLQVLNGTPFKNGVWRLLGVRIGKRVFDDGCSLPERAMVTIGDGCTLNAGSVVQCHSQEDGAFKSEPSRLGAGATLGVGAFVHYGVAVGARAFLAADCFLMKGETVPDDGRWVGNPARPAELHDDDDGGGFR
ncbi:Pls/PosA family non-ribosomal peptide synthetase [Streptomyces sp. NPDC090127]|uniref:Pls/PosA family non-ribosomal peptide synthetase n=1 Tax=Streptomyces sp. NPDC090127 TaxID=3365953 RepID=UPI0038273BE4